MTRLLLIIASSDDFCSIPHHNDRMRELYKYKIDIGWEAYFYLFFILNKEFSS